MTQTTKSEKECSRCKRLKRLEDFYNHRANKGTQCIECKKELQRLRYAGKKNSLCFAGAVPQNVQTPFTEIKIVDCSVWGKLYGKTLGEQEQLDIKTNVTALIQLLIDENIK